MQLTSYGNFYESVARRRPTKLLTDVDNPNFYESVKCHRDLTRSDFDKLDPLDSL